MFSEIRFIEAIFIIYNLKRRFTLMVIFVIQNLYIIIDFSGRRAFRILSKVHNQYLENAVTRLSSESVRDK